jgi:hypothetical protein
VGRNPWEGGVLHRLDTPTSGLVLVARTQRAFDDLWEEQRHDEIVKTYLAVSSKRLSPLPVGFVPFPFGDITLGRTVIRSLFRPFGEKGRVVRPVAEDSPSAHRGKSTGIWYETEVEFLGKDGTTCRFSPASSPGLPPSDPLPHGVGGISAGRGCDLSGTSGEAVRSHCARNTSSLIRRRASGCGASGRRREMGDQTGTETGTVAGTGTP